MLTSRSTGRPSIPIAKPLASGVEGSKLLIHPPQKSAKIHSAKVPDQDGIRLLLKGVRERLPRLSHLWMDAGYQGRGKDWAENVLGLSVEIVRRPAKPIPEEVARTWAEEWAKEGRRARRLSGRS